MRQQRLRHRTCACVATLVALAPLACVGRLPPAEPTPDRRDEGGVGDAGVGDAGVVDDAGELVDDAGELVDDAGQVEDGEFFVPDGGPLPFDATPPEGNALCARDWSTFNPRDVHILTEQGFVANVNDPYAYAVGVSGYFTVPIIRDVDGVLVYSPSPNISGLFEFNADRGGIVAQCPANGVSIADDVELPTSACEDDVFDRVSDFRLRPGSTHYVYRCRSDFAPWFDDEGVEVVPELDRHVLAVDGAGRLLLAEQSDAVDRLWVRDDGVDVAVDDFPYENQSMLWAQRTTRVIGYHFVMVAFDYTTFQAHALAIGRDGSIEEVATYQADGSSIPPDMRLDSALSLHLLISEYDQSTFSSRYVVVRIDRDGTTTRVWDGEGPLAARTLFTGP